MTRSPAPAFRRLLLATAAGLAILVGVASAPDAIDAASASPQVIAQASKEAAREAADAAREAAREAADAAREAAREAREQRKRGITIDMDVDRQYDSFDQFLDRDPGLAVLILGIVFIVFLTPILIIALIIWYKMRRNRMQNETMLRLAEKGVVPPSDALRAIANNRVDAVTSSLPLAEQASALTKRTAWSDLRKGVLLGTVGLAFVFHGMIEEGTAGWFGLTLLFVGIGYVVLWYFEDRQAAAFNAGRASVSPPVSSVSPPVRGPGDAGT
jgi:Domain of unknown function (DUF6249)